MFWDFGSLHLKASRRHSGQLLRQRQCETLQTLWPAVAAAAIRSFQAERLACMIVMVSSNLPHIGLHTLRERALGGHTPTYLVVDHRRWDILSFALYGECFSSV